MLIFMINLIIKTFFSLKIKTKMREQEKKRQRNHDLLKAGIKSIKNSEIIGISLRPPSCPDLNLLYYDIWGVFENKTNATSYLNIGLLVRRKVIKCLKSLF